ncbi:MAG: hypothetical protein Q8N27_05255 [Candidatus Hydromicrobium sp.]|nr:hypothetical protein [Candidatus Hydromicrobium sp.]
MLTKGDPYVVIKLRGAVAPSGDDIHIWVRGHKPAGAGCIGGPDGKLGVYDCERMIPVTGERPIDTPRTIERRQAPVDELCKQLSGSEPPIEPPASGFKRLVDSNGKLQGFLEE